ncbi:AraC family transcriptional regulator [Rhizobium sp. FKL33]|uniref:helix-turn-helix domain-containing protein n=1 Tax=Rhizobium sp. FKL33 TaxID=2562307 RepID=UPI0014858B19|nr:AraC family transcriptional regulator [Rhizobium sp. FKL33]
MDNATAQDFRYRSLPTATIEEIVKAYRNDRCRVQIHDEGRAAILNEVRHLQWGDFELFSATYVNDARLAMRHSNDVIAFLLPSNGQVEISLKSRRTLCTNGAIAIPGAKFSELKLPAGKRQVRLGISRRRFQRHIALPGGQSLEKPLRFDEAPKLDAQMLACLVNLIEAVFFELEHANTSIVSLAHKIDLIQIGLLAVWPNSLWHNNAENVAYIAPRHVRSSIEMIRADPFSPFDIPELARASGVSVRTLQHGFRQFTSYSISEFITRERMKTVRTKMDDAEFMKEIRKKIGSSAFRKLSLEYKIEYGRNIEDV